MTVHILSIRPQPDADLDVAALVRRGVPALACPVISPDYETASIATESRLHAPDEFAGLIFTSRHAVTGFMRQADGQDWGHIPAFCVGRATARLAAESGFMNLHTGHGGGAGLVPVIQQQITRTDLPLLWPSAEHISFDMVSALTPRQAVERLPVYRMVPTSHFDSQVSEALACGDVGAVIAMSPRSVRLFIDMLDATGQAGVRQQITLIAGSQAIATVAGDGWHDCLVARRPSRARLLAIASLLYHRRLS